MHPGQFSIPYLRRKGINMAYYLSRRSFIATMGVCAGAELFCRSSGAHGWRIAAKEQAPTVATLQAMMRTIEINGKPATVMGLQQPNGTQGLSSTVNHLFNVVLENKLSVPTAIHWHGLHPPNGEDGVPGLTQPIITANTSTRYDFPLQPAGTHWMHSHLGLQEASLLAAPLIVHDEADKIADEQEIVLFLGDFSFTPPSEIYAKLRTPLAAGKAGMGEKMAGRPPAQNMKRGKPDVSDVNYDAYLANDRTLADPEVVHVEKGGRIRLRIINGSSGTNFFIDLGSLTGELIATDGMPVIPIGASRFPLAIAQRIDVRLQLPQAGAFPILALREGTTEQTGIILATAGTSIKRLPATNAAPEGLLTLDLESRLIAATPLIQKTIDRTFVLRLQGDMAKYEWPINGVVFDTQNPASQKAQIQVKSGQRVAVKFINETGMSHPMHLHGHSFQVININGQPIKGAVRDTVLVPPRTSVTVVFDANNPGVWYMHCHILWHLAAGMATLVQYEA
jgi:FtsP/CotA-like multicopper oxidase with cupredoxin domain